MAKNEIIESAKTLESRAAELLERIKGLQGELNNSLQLAKRQENKLIEAEKAAAKAKAEREREERRKEFLESEERRGVYISADDEPEVNGYYPSPVPRRQRRSPSLPPKPNPRPRSPQSPKSSPPSSVPQRPTAPIPKSSPARIAGPARAGRAKGSPGATSPSIRIRASAIRAINPARAKGSPVSRGISPAEIPARLPLSYRRTTATKTRGSTFAPSITTRSSPRIRRPS